MKKAKLKSALEAASLSTVTSVEHDGEELELLPTIADEHGIDLEDQAQLDSLKPIVEQLLSDLTPRQLNTICNEFGLRGCRGSTPTEMALSYGCTRNSIFNIKAVALRKMRRQAVSMGLTRENLFT